MKFLAFIALVALCLTAGANAQSANGGNPTASLITIHNDTDMGVWITAYGVGGRKIEGAWMVQPHSEDPHGMRATIVDVRAEINAGGCTGPNRLDSQLETHNNSSGVFRLNGFVRHVNGKCTFST